MLNVFAMKSQCSAEKFHNWGQCPRALENVGTFEKKAGTLCEKLWDSDLEVKKSVFHKFASLLTIF